MMMQHLGRTPSEQGDENLLLAIFASHSFQQRILNWEEVSRQLIHRIRRESFDDEESLHLINQLREASNLPDEYWDIDLETLVAPVIPMKMDAGDGVALSMISTITTFGTPVDVLSQEIRIELVFPADPQTEAIMRANFAQSDLDSVGS